MHCVVPIVIQPPNSPNYMNSSEHYRQHFTRTQPTTSQIFQPDPQHTYINQSYTIATSGTIERLPKVQRNSGKA